MSRWAPSRARLGSGALVLVALALGQWLNANLPEGPEVSRPFERQAGTGEVVALRTMDVEATDVRGSTTVQEPASDPFLSPGLTVVVDLEITGRGEPGGIGWAELRARDGTRTVVPLGSPRGRIGCPISAPGIPTRCTLTVESRPDRLPGARLALARSGEGFDTRYDDMAVIDLGISSDDVDEWRDADPILLPAPGVEGLDQ